MTSTTQNRRSRKGAALIAVTAVLGIGTVATLASWTVTEFVSGQFTTGAVNPNGAIEASADGIAFDVHQSELAATSLSWSKDVTNLAGNDTIFASYYLRTAQGTTIAPKISLAANWLGGTTTGMGSALDTSIYALSNASDSCSATITSSTPGVTVVKEGGSHIPFTLPAATANAAGNAQKLCFKIKLSATTPENGTANGSWRFTAQK